MTLRPRRRMRVAARQQEPQQRAGGEQLDTAAEHSIRLAHRALERFPELVRRHKYVAGGAAVAGALVVLASVAIARRMRAGESADEAVESLTQAEIETLHVRDRDSRDEPERRDDGPGAARSDIEPTPISAAAHVNGTTANGAVASAADLGSGSA